MPCVLPSPRLPILDPHALCRMYIWTLLLLCRRLSISIEVLSGNTTFDRNWTALRPRNTSPSVLPAALLAPPEARPSANRRPFSQHQPLTSSTFTPASSSPFAKLVRLIFHLAVPARSSSDLHHGLLKLRPRPPACCPRDVAFDRRQSVNDRSRNSLGSSIHRAPASRNPPPADACGNAERRR